MSVDDPERPRRTLTVTKRAGASSQDAGKRKRSGARARLVAQQEKEREKAKPAEPASTAPRARGRDNAHAPHVRGRDNANAPHVRGRDNANAPHVRGRDNANAPHARGRDDANVPHARGRDNPDGSHARDRRDDAAPSRRAAERPDRAPRAAALDPRSRDDAAGTDTRPTPDEPRVRYAERPDRQRKRPRDAQERFQVFAPCPQGLEEVLAIELRTLGFDDARTGRAGAHFSADWTGVQHANLYSRLATRVLVQVAQGPVQVEDDLLDLAYATPWERWFGAERTLRVDTSAIKSPMRSLQYCNLRVKDGICDRLMDREGARPDIDTVRPDARVHAFLTSDTATLYLDTSGESLFKRGWRLDKGEAPLRENLAAGMLALAGWDPAAPLLDPFCGSGTILIEAAWIALGVPAGIARPFSFERLRDHDARRWQDIKDDARSRIQPRLDTPLFGYDADPDAIEHAKRNAERAWLTEDAIQFQVGDARDLQAPAEAGWIVTNPPYGERLEAGHDETLWRDWAACLKRQFAGWQVHAISSDMTLPQKMRLKPLRRIPLHNGPLDCRLFGFEVVSKSYREKPSDRRVQQGLDDGDEGYSDDAYDADDRDDHADD